MSSDNTYSVYYHKNRINGKVYVGKAKSIQKRWGHAGNGYIRNHDTVFANAIRKYGWDNFDHVVIADNLSQADAADMEKYYIELWKTNICKYGSAYGYNMTDGGDGSAGSSFGCKRVFCITTGELYPSVSIAAMENDISVTHLTAVCKGRRKSAHGLYWRYATEEDISNYSEFGNPVFAEGERDKIVSSALNNRKAQLYSNRFVKSNKPVLCIENGFIFPSIKAASLFAKIDMRYISKSVNDERKGIMSEAGGYHWSFYDKEVENMKGQFIYVFSREAKDKLVNAGFVLLKEDTKNDVYAFKADGTMMFSADWMNDISVVLSDTLTF